MKKIFLDKERELRIPIAIILSFLLFFVVCGFIVPLIVTELLTRFITSNEAVISIVYSVITAILIVIFTKLILEKGFSPDRLKNFDFNKKASKNVVKIIVGAFAGSCILSLHVLILFLLGEVDITYNGINLLNIITILVSYITAAMIEECMIRGVIETALSKINVVLGTLIASLIFTLLHGDVFASFDLIRFLELFAVAVLFSVAMHATKSLIVPIAMHAMFNFFSVAIFGIDDISGNTLFSTTNRNGYNIIFGGEFGGSIVTIVIIIALILLYYIYGKKNKKSVTSLQ